MAENRASANRLYRSRQERVIAGVAGGLAQYLNVDPTLVRLAFVVFGLVSGVGLLVYIALAIVMPQRPAGETEPAVNSSIDLRCNPEMLAYGLVGLGLLLLAGNLGVFHFLRWDFVWPALLIGLGILLLARRNRD